MAATTRPAPREPKVTPRVNWLRVQPNSSVMGLTKTEKVVLNPAISTKVTVEAARTTYQP